ncbi:MAG: hypothetical protein WCG42_03100 [Parachlamydiaceae bacterium]
MAINEAIKAVEELLNQCLKEKDLKKTLALSKQVPEKIAAILKMPNLVEANRKKIAELSSKWMEMQGSIVKQIDKQIGELKETASNVIKSEKNKAH